MSKSVRWFTGGLLYSLLINFLILSLVDGKVILLHGRTGEGLQDPYVLLLMISIFLGFVFSYIIDRMKWQ